MIQTEVLISMVHSHAEGATNKSRRRWSFAPQILSFFVGSLFFPAICYSTENESPIVESSKCNPIEILEGFAREHYPKVNPRDESIDIADDGDEWEITYLPSLKNMNQGFVLGVPLPVVLVVDKRACKIVGLKANQD